MEPTALPSVRGRKDLEPARANGPVLARASQPAPDPAYGADWAKAPFRALREARAVRGMTVGEVALQLAIRPEYVRAIEEGRIDDLPGAGPAGCMLSRYASLVGLDPELVVARSYVPAYFPDLTLSRFRRFGRQTSRYRPIGSARCGGRAPHAGTAAGRVADVRLFLAGIALWLGAAALLLGDLFTS